MGGETTEVVGGTDRRAVRGRALGPGDGRPAPPAGTSCPARRPSAGSAASTRRSAAGRRSSGRSRCSPSTAAAPSTRGSLDLDHVVPPAPITHGRRPARRGWPASTTRRSGSSTLLDRDRLRGRRSTDEPRSTVTPPTWRPDLHRPGRPGRGGAPARRLRQGAQRAADRAARQRADRRRSAAGASVGRALAEAGYVEVLSLPVRRRRRPLDALGLPADDPRRDAVRLANPLSDEEPLHAHHAAAAAARRAAPQPRPRASATWRCSSWAWSSCPAGPAGAPPAMGVDGPAADEELRGRRRAAAAPAVARRRGARRRRRAGRLVGRGPRGRLGRRGRGRPRSCAAAAGVTRRPSVRAGRRGAPWHPGRCAAIAGRRHRRRARRRAAPGGLRRARPAQAHLRDGARPRRGAAARRRRPRRGCPTFPPALIDVALVVDAAVPGRRRRGGAGRGRRRAAGVGAAVRRVRRARSSAQGRKSLAYKLTFRAAGPDAHRRGGGRGPRRRGRRRRRPVRRHPARRLTRPFGATLRVPAASIRSGDPPHSRTRAAASDRCGRPNGQSRPSTPAVAGTVRYRTENRLPRSRGKLVWEGRFTLSGSGTRPAEVVPSRRRAILRTVTWREVIPRARPAPSAGFDLGSPGGAARVRR